MTVGVCYSHICVGPEASCMPGRLCWGFPRTGSKTAGNGTCPGRHTGLPELPRSDSKSARLSRGRVAILPEGRADMRARRLHNWAHLGHERHGATSMLLTPKEEMGGDMRRERRPPWWLMYATAAVLSVRTSTCLLCSSNFKRRRASHSAKNSRRLIYHCSWGPVQSP